MQKNAACNLMEGIVNLSLFVIDIFVFSVLIPSRKARTSHRLLKK